jgi:hypothetical protein
MNGRIKLQIWSESLGRWRTVYVLPAGLTANVVLLRSYGIKFRVVEGCIS